MLVLELLRLLVLLLQPCYPLEQKPQPWRQMELRVVPLLVLRLA